MLDITTESLETSETAAETVPELTPEELVARMTDWIGEHQFLVSQAQQIASEIGDARLIDEQRTLPFEIMPDGDGFRISIHIDHPVMGHLYLHFRDSGEIEVDPGAEVWYQRHTLPSVAEAFKFVRSLVSAQMLKKFRALEDALSRRDRLRANNLIATHLVGYRGRVYPALKELTDYLATVENLHINLPLPGGKDHLVKFKDFTGSLPTLITTHPESFYVTGSALRFDKSELVGEDSEFDARERAPESVAVGDRIADFHRIEQQESAILFAGQRLGVSYGYKVEVVNGSRIVKADAAGIVEDRFVGVSPEGYVLVRSVIEASEIVLRSKLEI